MALFLFPDEARDEILQLMTGKDEDIIEEDTESQFDLLRDDIIEKSKEFIKDHLMTLDWEEMQQLVAGLLQAMGYKSRVSAKGADRGVDIVASPDGLGLDTPRIFVEVKHRVTTKVDSKMIRSFIGGRKSSDSCLYVSTGGFSKDADIDKAQIMRTKGGEKETIKIKVTDITKKGDKEKDIILEPGDLIFIPESFF